MVFDKRDIQKITDGIVYVGDCWISNSNSVSVRCDEGWRTMLAHRVMWIHANGSDIPEGLVVRHRCARRRCCNPEHLKIGTQKENMWDEAARYTLGVQAGQLATYEDLPAWVPPPLRGDQRRKKIAARMKYLIDYGREYGVTDAEFREMLENSLAECQ